MKLEVVNVMDGYDVVKGKVSGVSLCMEYVWRLLLAPPPLTTNDSGAVVLQLPPSALTRFQPRYFWQQRLESFALSLIRVQHCSRPTSFAPNIVRAQLSRLSFSALFNVFQ